MKRALMSATVPSMIGQFNMNNLKMLVDLGYQVDVACEFEKQTVWAKEKVERFKADLKDMGIHIYQIDFARNLFDVKRHIVSYKQIKHLLNEKQYDLIHTHTPISSFLLRIANRHCHNYAHTKVIYTAHGFHFFKGNSPIRNLIFKTIEKRAAKYTDCLITINKEDYAAAAKFRLKPQGTIAYMPGIGIDIEKIHNIDCEGFDLRKSLNIPQNTKLLLSVGELNDNKNHRIVIESLAELPKDFHFIICGTGALKDSMVKLTTELNLFDRVHFLGFRNDVIQIMKQSDFFIFPSKREGLPVSLLEAMACDMICFVSDIRGNQDLIQNGINGYISSLKNFKSELVDTLTCKTIPKSQFISYNREKIYDYGQEAISKKMLSIYKNLTTERR